MGRKATTPIILCGVLVLSLARRPSATKERCGDQSCLFQQGDYRNKGNNDIVSWVLSPGEGAFCIQ
jgi:hypothetical protein